MYDPAGSGLVPWFNGSGLYDWRQAYCGKVWFRKNVGVSLSMTMSAYSLYQGTFNRTWTVATFPGFESAILGFDISGPTLMYVAYSDSFGNLILGTGTTTTFFLSTSVSSLGPAQKSILQNVLSVMGIDSDLNYIYGIDNSGC